MRITKIPIRKRFQDLGEFLKNERLKSSLSQAEVSDFLNYSSAQFISNIERGLSSPPLKDLKKLSDLYKIKTNELLKIMFTEQKRWLRFEQAQIKKELAAKTKKL